MLCEVIFHVVWRTRDSVGGVVCLPPTVEFGSFTEVGNGCAFRTQHCEFVVQLFVDLDIKAESPWTRRMVIHMKPTFG